MANCNPLYQTIKYKTNTFWVGELRAHMSSHLDVYYRYLINIHLNLFTDRENWIQDSLLHFGYHMSHTHLFMLWSFIKCNIAFNCTYLQYQRHEIDQSILLTPKPLTYFMVLPIETERLYLQQQKYYLLLNFKAMDLYCLSKWRKQ